MLPVPVGARAGLVHYVGPVDLAMETVEAYRRGRVPGADSEPIVLVAAERAIPSHVQSKTRGGRRRRGPGPEGKLTARTTVEVQVHDEAVETRRGASDHDSHLPDMGHYHRAWLRWHGLEILGQVRSLLLYGAAVGRKVPTPVRGRGRGLEYLVR